ncbi:hypothetical protein EHS25_001394 [Saitozyma podzolica]|uniref:Uncharacterized protein n=1 Tax=Saitozyma podzolica TaxID=1890683 RepID=A0A427YFW2_9TREE|nr:hypothetical protein EHS25_001394 [Saitozyma podzolica]
MTHTVSSLDGDLRVSCPPAHHARTTSEPMGSIGVSFSSSETPWRAGKFRPTLRILTDLPTIPTIPTVPTTHRPPNPRHPRHHRAINTAPLLAGFSVVHPGGLREDDTDAPSLLARRRREVAVFEFAPSLGGDENTARRGVSRLLQKPGWGEEAEEIEVEGVHLSGEGEVGTVGQVPSGRKRFKRHRRTISDKFKSLLVFHRESRTDTIPSSQDGQVEHADNQTDRDASTGLGLDVDVDVILPSRPYRSPGTASFMVSRPGPDPPLSSRKGNDSLAVTVDPDPLEGSGRSCWDGRT